ncbi:S1 family peptidase [Spongiactinospora sp. TRM90649]|uniref:S1 family peptidase n=1 Tax=Spongiactinospora sp. TRM90649 TaxID=3031114 RepID=UPI0023F7E900|nr:S1 family peptidase [Spongiactinospora sp. TRM90649]MDF5756274.1 S1 family peptidase [Spongiactinospora sp. TRM90649]
MNKRLLVALSLCVAVPASAGVANAGSAASATGGTSTVVLTRDRQPLLEHPTVDRLLQDARASKTPFRKALDEYARETARRIPAARSALPDGPVSDPVVKIDGIPLAELIDLARLAEGMGITPEEAVGRYAWAPAVARVAQRLTKELPAEVAGAALVKDGRALRLGFKGAVPRRAVELARTLPGEVQLVGDKGFSTAELKEIRDSNHAVLAARPNVERVKGTYDAETGTVSFKIQPKRPVGEDLRADLRPAEPANPRITIDVSVVDDLGIKEKDDNLRGGGFSYLEDDTPWCTMGFSVIRTNGTRGITTAKHCADDAAIQYANHPDDDTGRTTVTRSARAASYDMARYQGGDFTYTRTFYYELNQSRYVTHAAYPTVIDMPMCAFGRASAEDDGVGTACGVVTDTDVWWDEGYEDNFETNFDRIGGDSGGPVYWGSTAYGLVYAGTEGFTFSAKIANVDQPGGFGGNWRVWTCPTC